MKIRSLQRVLDLRYFADTPYEFIEGRLGLTDLNEYVGLVSLLRSATATCSRSAVEAIKRRDERNLIVAA